MIIRDSFKLSLMSDLAIKVDGFYWITQAGFRENMLTPASFFNVQQEPFAWSFSALKNFDLAILIYQ